MPLATPRRADGVVGGKEGEGGGGGRKKIQEAAAVEWI